MDVFIERAMDGDSGVFIDLTDTLYAWNNSASW